MGARSAPAALTAARSFVLNENVDSPHGRLPCRTIVLRPRRLLTGLAVAFGDFCDFMLRCLPSVGPRFAPIGATLTHQVGTATIASTTERCGES